MKKYIALLLSVLLILTLFGCAVKQTDSKPDVQDIVEETHIQYIEETTSETTAETSSQPKSDKTVEKEEAISIALNHAQLKQEDVTLLFTELDFDDGIYKYEVDFRYDKYEYDYEINAKTGDIISFEKDLFD